MLPPVVGSVFFGGFGTVFKYSTIASISAGCNPSLKPGILPEPLRMISLIGSSLPLIRSLYRAGPYIWNPGLAGAWQMAQRCWKTRCPNFWTSLNGLSALVCCACPVSGKMPRKITKAHRMCFMEGSPRQTLPRRGLKQTGSFKQKLKHFYSESSGSTESDSPPSHKRAAQAMGYHLSSREGLAKLRDRSCSDGAGLWAKSARPPDNVRLAWAHLYWVCGSWVCLILEGEGEV